MSKQRVKLSDVAKELNISVSTVSIVLAGKAEQNRIGKEMAKMVLAKAKELGYQTNIMARSLRTGKSGIIGLVLADIGNPYFGRMARYIENEAQKLGYQVMFGSSDEDTDKLSSIMRVFHSRQVDGFIVVPVEDCESALQKVGLNEIPMVFIDRACKNLPIDTICADNYQGSLELTQNLIQRGYKRIAAFVYDLQLSNYKDRIDGYKAAINSEEGNRESIVYKIDFHNVGDELKKALDKAISLGCDAFYFANNSLGILSLKMLGQIDKDLLKNLGMASFDNPEVFDFCEPQITSFEQPIKEICSRSVQLLFERINNKQSSEVQHINLAGKLICRNVE